MTQKNKMHILILFSLIFIQIADNRKTDRPDQVFQPYVERFEHNFNVKINNIGMNFNSLNDDTVGICYYNITGNYIEIDRGFWDKSNDLTREVLIFHELGHCFMYLDHDDNYIDMGDQISPRSIMFPYVLSSKTYAKYKNYYINELNEKYLQNKKNSDRIKK